MRKFFVTIFAFFATTTAWSAPQPTSFSVQCSFPGSVDCKIIGDTGSSIITINTCNELKKYSKKTPGRGKALLVKRNTNEELAECLQLTNFNDKQCNREIRHLGETISQQNPDMLISCAKETSYETTYISGNDYHKGNLLNVSYDAQKCITSGGTPTEDGGCLCAKDEENIGGQCFCNYGKIKFPKTANSCPDAYLTTCMATGGTNKKHFDPTTECICPKDKHLVPSDDKGSCVCETGYIYQDPTDKRLGCVEQDKTLNINITVTDVNNQALSNVTAAYNTKDGEIKTAATNASGLLNISNVPNTAYIKLTKNGYAPTIYSAVDLSTENKVTLYQKSNNTYQACLPQSQNSTRSDAGLQIDSNQYVYCGNTNERDCSTNDKVKGADNRLHKCTNNSWVDVDTSNADKCNGHVLKYAHEPIDLQDNSVVLITDHSQRPLPDGVSYTSAAVTSYCKINDLENYCTNHTIRKSNNVCDNRSETPTSLNTTMPDQGKEIQEGGDDDCTRSGGTPDNNNKCDCNINDNLIKNDDETKCICANGFTRQKETDKCEPVDSQNPENMQNQAGNNTETGSNSEELEEKLKSAKDALAAAKEKENSWANRGVTAASSAMTGLGGMQLAEGISEQKSDAEAEKQMRAYIETMKCEYGGGKQVDLGVEETLPGGNELLEYYTEYKTLADNLKTTKAALGLRNGIESETLYDRAQSGLYQYASTGKTGGGETSLFRALTDAKSTDATAWSEQKENTSKKLKVGGGVAAGGAAVGIIGNAAINTDMIQNIKDAFKKD